MKNRGILRIGAQMISALLHVPDGHRIVAMRPANDGFDAVELLMEGDTLPPVSDNCVTPHVRLQVTITETDTMVRERTFEGRFE